MVCIKIIICSRLRNVSSWNWGSSTKLAKWTSIELNFANKAQARNAAIVLDAVSFEGLFERTPPPTNDARSSFGLSV